MSTKPRAVHASRPGGDGSTIGIVCSSDTGSLLAAGFEQVGFVEGRSSERRAVAGVIGQ